MKAVVVPIALAASAILAGCKNPVYDIDVQFSEKLVIEGVLAPGASVTGIYIGKTLPLTAAFDPTEAEVHDAVATVVVDGIGYPLRHVGSGLYENSSLVAQSGKVYVLAVEWNGLRAAAHTVVPFPPDTASLAFTPVTLTYSDRQRATFGIDASFLPKSGETYGAAWTHNIYESFIGGYVYVERSSHPPLVRSIDIQSDGQVHVSVSGAISEDRVVASDTIFVSISSFDEQFFDYYNSNGTTTSFDNLVLGLSPGEVNWNVSGDGIGMFIGKVSITRRVAFRW